MPDPAKRPTRWTTRESSGSRGQRRERHPGPGRTQSRGREESERQATTPERRGGGRSPGRPPDGRAGGRAGRGATQDGGRGDDDTTRGHAGWGARAKIELSKIHPIEQIISNASQDARAVRSQFKQYLNTSSFHAWRLNMPCPNVCRAASSWPRAPPCMRVAIVKACACITEAHCNLGRPLRRFPGSRRREVPLWKTVWRGSDSSGMADTSP